MSAETLLEVEDLSVAFGGVRAVDGVSLRVPAGGLVGILGPNGAGKTTLIDAVTGFVRTPGGRVTFAGRPLGGVPAHARARAGMCRTFQALQLFDDLTVRENVMIPTERRSLLSWRRRHGGAERVERALALSGAAAYADRLPSELSHGRRSLASVARALAGDPRLLLLDEPAAGLDRAETQELGEGIRRIAADGVTIVLIDHDTSLVLGVCDTVHVLDHGRLIASGPPERIRRDPLVIEAYLGSAEDEDVAERARA